ncbi:MAG: cysteine desulfurase [Chloroflexi bacterium GWB2_49_20]|nr:MAG: cysteine desulfurase [Chloroflexi bacterium GWB2_49_20]OGN76843.1 MAG: cysteine desulfurase [Chloroflexi bacterium GWC2_49_37]OGN84363.1 MAG: cysteine desulfurase [Chloroflexi bacterium GWD2_49_16]HCC78253.1 cysteine desulfurase [Anaerolineae bacterium]HCM96713.1 cysteine desulfurase [Anaerolineae bacterium]
MTALDVKKIRADFPILDRQVHPGVPLVYLDSTATSQKPLVVIEALNSFYRTYNANIHRGIHVLAEEATAMYEDSRVKVARFINAPSARQVIFTRNTTESINLVAYSWARANLKSGDLIILTEMEHHSNLIPWHMLAFEGGVRLEFIPVNETGSLDMQVYQELLKQEPRLVAFTHMSNVLGTINPAAEIIRRAHAAGAITLLDGAQSVPHLSVDVQELDADFLVFSAHKMLGPTGIGALYGKLELLENMPPFLGGGDMIKTVHLRSFLPNSLPHKFEAGTPAISEAIGFGSAVEYLEGLGMTQVEAHEQEMIHYALERLEEIPGVRVYGPPAEHKGAVAAFTLEDIHPHDVAQILDRYGVAVRAGHHCAQPLHEKLGIPATTRASFYIYNMPHEVDQLVAGIYQVKKMFS